jgi:hypothetical protein
MILQVDLATEKLTELHSFPIKSKSITLCHTYDKDDRAVKALIYLNECNMLVAGLDAGGLMVLLREGG